MQTSMVSHKEFWLDAIEFVWRSVYLIIGIFTSVIMNVSAGASNVKSSTSSAKKTPSDLADLIVSTHVNNYHLSDTSWLDFDIWLPVISKGCVAHGII